MSVDGDRFVKSQVVLRVVRKEKDIGGRYPFSSNEFRFVVQFAEALEEPDEPVICELFSDRRTKSFVKYSFRCHKPNVVLRFNTSRAS